jgi:hypothetical protein
MEPIPPHRRVAIGFEGDAGMRRTRRPSVVLAASLLAMAGAAPAANAAGPLSCDPQPHRIRAATGWFTTDADGAVRANAADDPASVAQQFRVCTSLTWQQGNVALQSQRNGRWLQPDLVGAVRADGVGDPGTADLFTIATDASTKLSVIRSVAAQRYLDARADLPGTPVTATATGPKDWEPVEITPEIRLP